MSEPSEKYLSHERRQKIRERAEQAQNTDAIALLDHIADREAVNQRSMRKFIDIVHDEETELETRALRAEAEVANLRQILATIRGLEEGKIDS